MELFGPEIAPFAAIACIASYLVSGHTGIYHAQRVGHSKHRHALPADIRLSEIKKFHSQRNAESTPKAEDKQK
jgi:H+/Cl- antiporter ClcA